jgi:alpha-amylase
LGEAAKAFAVFSILWKGVPLIYSGQEMPVKRRIQFFDKDPLDWSARPLLHNFFQKLLTLRSDNPAMNTANENAELFRVATTDGGHIFSFMRKHGSSEVLVFLNLSSEETEFAIIDERVGGNYTEIFNQDQAEIFQESKLKLKAWDFFVYQK